MLIFLDFWIITSMFYAKSFYIISDIDARLMRVSPLISDTTRFVSIYSTVAKVITKRRIL